MNINEEQKRAIEDAMEVLSEVRTGGDDEVECHNRGILLGHSFGIYHNEGDKEHAEYLIEEGLV